MTLRLRRGAVTGESPFTSDGSVWVDVQERRAFGSTSLETADFQTAATVVQGASLTAADEWRWSEGAPEGGGCCRSQQDGNDAAAHLLPVDDNDDGRPDYVGFYSGDNATAANRPQSPVQYQ